MFSRYFCPLHVRGPPGPKDGGPGEGRSTARTRVAGPTQVGGTRSSMPCSGRSSGKGSLGRSFTTGTPCPRTAIGRRRPGRKVSWRRGKRRRFETTQRFMWTYTWGTRFWEGFADVVMTKYCQTWHLDFADFRPGMFTAPVPFAKRICWEQELTEQNSKKSNQLPLLLYLQQTIPG